MIVLSATIVFATYLRVSYVTYGLPYVYNGDELINFRIIQSLLVRRSLDPQFFSYPSLLFYLNLPVQMLLKNISGEIMPVVSQSMGNGYAPQPVALLLARLVTFAFGIGTVVASWRLAKAINLGPVYAFLAAIMVSATPLLVLHSSYVTPDIIASFFATTALAASIAVAHRMEWQNYVLAGILAGLAAATKYNAGLVVLAIPVAHLTGHRFHRFVPMMALTAAFAILGLLLASPYLVLSPGPALDGFLYELRHYATGHAGAQGDTLKTNILWVFRETGWTWLFLSGLALARDRWRTLAPVAAFAIIYFVLLSVQVVRFDRNLLPMLPAIFVLLAAGAQILANRLRLRTLGTVLAAGLFLVVAITGPIVTTTQRLERYVRDPRADLRQWLESYTNDGRKIAVDAYSPYLKGAPGTQITGKFLVLALPVNELLDMDYVVVRKVGLGRLLDTGESPYMATFRTLSEAACETGQYPAPPARAQWTVFKLKCR